MRETSVFILAASLLVVSFWGAGTGYCDYARGQSIFNNKCAICHGSDGKGNGPAAASLSPPPADFNSASFWQDMTDAKITNTIQNGHGPMPAFNLSSGDIRSVIEYLRQTFQP
jgi:mono/diheme cytochrome c family protein